jgi:hypothetical protein
MNFIVLMLILSILTLELVWVNANRKLSTEQSIFGNESLSYDPLALKWLHLLYGNWHF